jgi:hypothetical protein
MQNLIESACADWSDVLGFALIMESNREGDPPTNIRFEDSDYLAFKTVTSSEYLSMLADVFAPRLELVFASLAEDRPAMERLLANAAFTQTSGNALAGAGFSKWFLKRKMVSNVNRLSMFGLLAPLATAVSAAQASAGRTGLFQRKAAAVDPAHLVALTGTLVIHALVSESSRLNSWGWV